ncbi:transporter [Shewanella sp. NIFS-20-20]|uniref:transporter n=1 Tax=Shewanella sp. NIFS-20-20 TaxID=2853806 RepID=UPI001C49480D|nr:transporter [Shewanella sp. NIFS-20-20]MBV7314083.1 transporter [Shewanella sp. NIFS-20-20]
MLHLRHLHWCVCLALTANVAIAESESDKPPKVAEATTQEQQELALLKRQLILMNKQVQQQQQALLQMAKKIQAREQALNRNQPVERQDNSAQAVANTEAASQPKVATKPAAVASEATNKKAPDMGRSTEDVLAETHNVFTRKFTLESSLSYSYFSRKDLILRGFLALDAIFLGNLNLDRVRTSNLQFDLVGRYTLNPQWQFELAVPYLYRSNQYDSVGEGNSSQRYESAQVNDALLGDISAGVYYRIMAEQGAWPDWVWNVRVRMPTGKHPYDIDLVSSESGNLTYPIETPSGAGNWGVSTGFSLAKTYDPAIVFFNLNYGWNLPQQFDDISGLGEFDTPGTIDLGDYVDYSLGLAFAVSERMSLGMSFNQRFYGRTRQRLDGQGWEKIPRSDTNTATLGIGATLALSDNLSMVTSIGAGLTEDTPDYQISLRFPYRF